MASVVFQDLYDLSTFLKTKASRILHIKTFDTELEHLRLKSVLADTEFGEYNHFLNPENQLFLNSYELELLTQDESFDNKGFVLVVLNFSKSCCLNLLNNFITDSFAKVIVVSSCEHHLDKYFPSQDDDYFTAKTSESIHFGCLSKKTQTDLLDLTCILNENKLLPLKDFLYINSTSHPRLKTLFNADTLKNMLNKQIYSDQINYDIYSRYPQFYVNRKFVEYRVGVEALKEFCGLIIIGGVDRLKLASILGAKMLKNERFLVCKKFHHAHRLFNYIKTGVNVAIFLRYSRHKQVFTWVDSKGCIGNFKKMFAETCNQSDLVRKRCVILSGLAGTGKTTTMIHLCNQLNSHRWIIFMDLSKNLPVPMNLTKELVVDFIWAWTDKHYFTKALLHDALFSTNARPVCLILDEFNRTFKREPLLKVLTFLKDFTRAHIWITARPIDVDDLENALSVRSTRIVEIDGCQEEAYLRKTGLERGDKVFASCENKFGKLLILRTFSKALVREETHEPSWEVLHAIMFSTNNSPVVAECLLAKDLYYLMLTSQLPSELLKFLLTKCLIQPQYSYVRIFLNYYFAEKAVINDTVAEAIQKLWLQDRNSFFNKNSDWALAVLIKEDLCNLTYWFLSTDFFQHNANIIAYQPVSGKTILNLAIDKRNTIVCKAILDTYNQEELIHNSLDNGEYYKNVLAKMNRPWVSDILHQSKKAVNLTVDDDFYQAAKEGFIDKVKQLLEAGANVNYETKQLKTALLISIQKNHSNVASYLLQHEQTDLLWCDKSGCSYLAQAAKFGSIEVAQALLHKKGDINHKDNLGLSPLSWAVKMGHVSMINLLISQGADCFVRDNLGSNLIHVALKARRWDVVKYLTFWQLSVSNETLHGVTPLGRALKSNNWGIIKHLILEGASVSTGVFRAAFKANRWSLLQIMLQKNVSLAGFEEKDVVLKRFLPAGDDCERVSYLMQLGCVDLLESYLEELPYNANEVEDMLSELYEELLANKRQVSEVIKIFTEKRIYGIRAGRGQETIKVNDKSENAQQCFKKRLRLICDNIREITESDGDDEKFETNASFIAQQIEVVKHHDQIRNHCPAFKETQFCLLIFLNYFQKKQQDPVYALVLNKIKLIGYLGHILEATENYLNNGQFIQTGFKSDFRLLTDIYSLKTIWTQIKTILDESHLRHDINVYGLIRCLQVIGESVKNSKDHPNLSDGVHKHLMYQASTSVQQILARLRDSITHPKLLMERVQFEQRLLQDKKVYESVKNDLKKILVDVEFILVDKKAQAIKIFLQSAEDCTSPKEFKEITKHFQYVHFIDFYERGVYICEEMEATLASIEELKTLLQDHEITRLNQIENDIKGFLEKTKSNANRVRDSYLDIWLNLRTLIDTKNATHINIQKCLIDNLKPYNNRPTINSSIILSEMLERNRREFQENQQDETTIRINNILGNLIHLIEFQLYRADKLEEIQGTLGISKNETEEEKIDLLDEIFNEIKDNIREGVTEFDVFINESKHNHPIFKLISQTPSQDAINQLLDGNNKLKTTLKRQLKKNSNAIRDLVGKLNLYGKMLNNITDSDKNYYDLLDQIKSFFALMGNDEINIVVDGYIRNQLQKIENFYKNKYDLLDSVVKTNKSDLARPLVRAAVDILLLDILTYLADRGCIKEYSMSYDQYSPILVNTALRNYLAHGNILTDYLPLDPHRSVLNFIAWLRNQASFSQKVAPETYLFPENIAKKNLIKGKFIDLPETKPLYVTFLKAAENGDFHSLINVLDNTLLDSKTHISMTRFEGFLWPAIYYASIQGHANIVSELLERIRETYPCTVQSGILIRLAKQTVARLDADSYNASISYNNVPALFHQTCLHEAAKSDKTILQYLLKYCSDPDVRDSSGNTPLIIAVENGRLDCAKILLDSNKVDVNAKNVLSGTALQKAIIHGHEHIAKLLLERGASVEGFDDYGFSALGYSVRYGFKNIVQYILTRRVRVDAVSHYTSASTALHIAETGQEDLLTVLIDAEADVNAVNMQGSTALSLAISNGHEKLAKRLLQVDNIDFNKTNVNQHDAFYLAAERDMADIVEILIEKGTELESMDKNKRTALLASSENGCVSVVRLLLDKNADIYATDICGNTALHLAIHKNQQAVVELLLHSVNNPNFTNATNFTGYTSLHVAAMYGKQDLLELLIHNGARFNVKDANGDTALHMAALKGHEHVIDKLLSFPDMARYINSVNGDDLAPLHLAAYNGFDRAVESLLKNRAEVNVRGCNNDATPLHCAAQNNHYNIVKMLIKAQADVNALTQSGNSAIYIAASLGFERVVKLLLLQTPKPNLNVTDELGNTALLCPCQFGYHKIVKLLLSHGAEPDAGPNLLVAVGHGHTENVKLLLQYDAVNLIETALVAACQQNQTEIAAMLIEKGPDVDFLYKNKFSALYNASSHGNSNICQKLIAAGAEVNLQNENGFTVLHVAADKGHYDVVKMLLLAGAAVDATTVANKSALHFACEKGHKRVVSLLLQHEAQVNLVVNDSLLTPLHFAAMNGHTAVVKLLLAKGADVNSISHDETTPLDLAVQNGHLKVVLELLKHVNVTESTALHAATSSNHRAIVELLIARGADVNMRDSDGVTPLHNATITGNKHVMNLLIKHGCDVNALADTHESSHIQFFEYDNCIAALHAAAYCTDDTVIDILLNHPRIVVDILDAKNRTPLHQSVLIDNAVIAEKLFRQGSSAVNLADAELRTPLHYSVANNNEYITKLLLEKVDDIDCADKDRSTCLHIAVKNGHLPLARLLIQHGACVNVKDIMLYTPLHYAAKIGSLDIIKILLTQGANVNATTCSWDTPLMLVCYNGNIEAANIMLQYGADSTARNINCVNSLHIAAEQNNLEMVIKLLNAVNLNDVDASLHSALHHCGKTGNALIAAYLIQNGIDLDAVTIDQLTALHFGAIQGFTGFVEVLLRCGADVNARDVNRRTPLHYACETGHEDIVKLLLTNGAEVDNCDTDLCTALHKASELGFKQIVEMLLNQNARVDLIDINGFTALHYAIQNNNQAIVEQLLLQGAQIDRSNNNLKCTSMLNMASSLGHIQLVDLLLKYDTFADIFGRTALHYAALNGHTPIVQILLTQAVDKDAQDYASETALHYAAKGGFADTAKSLIESNCNANLTNADRQTALHLAAESGKADLVDLLLPHLDIDATDASGETALHIAVAGNYKDVVRCLIEHHASINAASTIVNVTPLHLAAASGDLELVTILVNNGADLTAIDRYGRTAYVVASEMFGGESEFCQDLMSLFLVKMNVIFDMET